MLARGLQQDLLSVKIDILSFVVCVNFSQSHSTLAFGSCTKWKTMCPLFTLCFSRDNFLWSIFKQHIGGDSTFFNNVQMKTFRGGRCVFTEYCVEFYVFLVSLLLSWKLFPPRVYVLLLLPLVWLSAPILLIVMSAHLGIVTAFSICHVHGTKVLLRHIWLDYGLLFLPCENIYCSLW